MIEEMDVAKMKWSNLALELAYCHWRRMIYALNMAKYAIYLGNSGIYTPSNGGTLTHNLSDPNQIRQTFTPESFSGS